MMKVYWIKNKEHNDNKAGGLPAMTRWHFDNCKGKI